MLDKVSERGAKDTRGRFKLMRRKKLTTPKKTKRQQKAYKTEQRNKKTEQHEANQNMRMISGATEGLIRF